MRNQPPRQLLLVRLLLTGAQLRSFHRRQSPAAEARGATSQLCGAFLGAVGRVIPSAVQSCSPKSAIIDFPKQIVWGKKLNFSEVQQCNTRKTLMCKLFTSGWKLE